MMPPRVRFAPSPTGFLHVGNARTALFNWLFARKERGTFVLRIEDTDTARAERGAERQIFEDLLWLGLGWDEGPVPPAPAEPSASAHRGPTEGAGAGPIAGGGEPERERSERSAGAAGRHGPYRQSERGTSYRARLEALLSRGEAYPCFCADEELEEDRRRALAEGRTPGYTGRCAKIPAGEGDRRRALEAHAFRFRVGAYGVVRDLLRGEVDFRSRQAFDPVIVRRDGRPTYNFAVVVDDAEMEITHVLRGEDHLTNTALQLRLYEALGLRPPMFGHLPLILGADGVPLSKRHGATSVGEHRALGYPPEALVNALGLLGWTPPGESVLMTLEEMLDLFTLERVSATPAIFDVSKLDWISSQKIRTMDRARRAEGVASALAAQGLLPARAARGSERAIASWLAGLGDLLASSLARFGEVGERSDFIFAFDAAAAVSGGALAEPGSRLALTAFADIFGRGWPDPTAAGAAERIDEAKRATGLKGRALLHPLRLAVTGREAGPELVQSLPLIEQASQIALTPALPGVAGRIRAVLSAAGGERDCPQ